MRGDTMGKLDEHVEEAERDNAGKKVADKTKSEVKKKTKSGVKKLGKKAAKKVGNTLAKTKAGTAVVGAAKAVGTAAASGLKAFIAFLATPPLGWICAAFLVLGVIWLADNISTDTTLEVDGVTVLSEDETLSEEEALLLLTNDCPEEVVATVGDIDTDTQMLANAQLVYSVFKQYGLPDECIAGMLGNLQHESLGIDPTCIEGIYSEPYQMGVKTTEASNDLDAYVRNVLGPAYASNGNDYTQGSGYTGSDGKKYPGMGLIQWTGPGAEDMVTVASNTGNDWWTMEYQLAYMLTDSLYRAGFFAEWKENPSTSVSDATQYFRFTYEGNTQLGMEACQTYAEAWYGQIQTWTVNTQYADSIFAAANSMGGAASNNATADALDDCNDSANFDNSSIASAAVSFAYATTSEGNGNNGTPLFVQVHDNIWGSEAIYMSCDMCVATAVVWSGSDDTFPKGDTGFQHSYLASSPKWESIGMTTSLSMADLQPGDIFAMTGHTFLYTGSELIQQVHGSSASATSDSVSASIGERSPGCGNDSTDIIVNNGGQDWLGRGAYEVFRCVQPDNSPVYQNAGASANYETP